MTRYFLIKLSEKVKNCNSNQIEDFGFEYDSLTEGFTSMWITIHNMPIDEDYCIVIRENGKVYLAQGDTNLFQIGSDDAENWKALANDLFQDHYSEEIEDAKKENAYNNWLDYQDAMGEMLRHAL